MNKTITYTEEKGKKPFDWNVFLDKEYITDEEWEEASILANNWITCACGNQCVIIKRDFDGAPIDVILEELGVNFATFIEYQDVVGAKMTLNEIENRSAELIKEIRDGC